MLGHPGGQTDGRRAATAPRAFLYRKSGGIGLVVLWTAAPTVLSARVRSGRLALHSDLTRPTAATRRCLSVCRAATPRASRRATRFALRALCFGPFATRRQDEFGLVYRTGWLYSVPTGALHGPRAGRAARFLASPLSPVSPRSRLAAPAWPSHHVLP